MNVLAIDTSGADMGVAVRTTGGSVCATIHRAGLRHGETLAPVIADLLSTAGLEALALGLIVVTLGPGSFTGVRIGMSTAMGLSLGSACPMVGVSSLDALARRFSFYPGVVLPVVDAKRGRVYAALYRGGVRMGDHMDIEPKALARQVGSDPVPHLVTGPHSAVFHGLVLASQVPGAARLDLDPQPTGTDPLAVLELGAERYARQGADPQPLAPLYLRPSEAELLERSRG